MENENKITESIEAAFEAETKAVESAETEEKADVSKTENATEDAEKKSDTDPAEKQDNKKDDETKDGPEKKSDEEIVAAPKQLKNDFVKSHWDNADKETKDEFVRLATENERNFSRAAEAEYNIKQYRKTIEPVQGYIAEVAQTSNISESEVVRNCVHIVQSLNDNPTLTARQMIAAGMLKFEDPVAVINEIAKTYNIDTKGDLTPRDIPNSYYAANAQAKYDARQAKYVKPEEIDKDESEFIMEYVNNTPGIKALVDDPAIKDKFLHQITLERMSDSKSSNIAIINRAAELFENRVVQKPAPVAETPKENLVEKKLAKVVSPTASNPIEQGASKREMSVEDAVRKSLESLGLGD